MAHSLKIVLPQKPVFYWRKACEFGAKGFSAADLAGTSCGESYTHAQQWIRKMRKLGELIVTGSSSSAGGNKFTYAVRRPRPKAPSLQFASGGKYGLAREQVWQTMRMLKGSWTVEELALASSTEDVKVLRDSAQRYVRALVRAGIVVIVRPATFSKRGSTAVRYALSLAGNTGPLPPMLYQATFVFDRNLQQIIGESKVRDALTSMNGKS
jgi:hypothetical protein